MAEVRSVSSTGGQKGVKAQAYDLIPPNGILELARLYGVGARKYADHNFRLGYEWSKTYASLHRHAALFWSGEDTDLELGVNHMSSVAWHAFTITEFYYSRPNFDNRPIPSELPASSYDVPNIPKREFPVKHVDGKVRADGRAEPRFDLIPQRPLADLAAFYGAGAAQPVRTEGHLWSDDFAKICEHAYRFWGGENIDPDSGFLHTIHIAHHALNLIELSERFPEYDDRLIEGAAPIGFTSEPNK